MVPQAGKAQERARRDREVGHLADPGKAVQTLPREREPEPEGVTRVEVALGDPQRVGGPGEGGEA
jgi:hypothetical protein